MRCSYVMDIDPLEIIYSAIFRHGLSLLLISIKEILLTLSVDVELNPIYTKHQKIIFGTRPILKSKLVLVVQNNQLATRIRCQKMF